MSGPWENNWFEHLPASRRSLYEGVLTAFNERGLRYLTGGAVALGSYTGIIRDTTDLDFYVLPADRALFTGLLTELGWADYYDRLPYDRSWIHRSFKEDSIVDVIFGTANHASTVEERWFARSHTAILGRFNVPILAPEEIIRTKAYVLQRDRCDWPDLLNLLYCTASSLDWNYLISELEDDCMLLGAILTIFRWLSPEVASGVPEWVISKTTGHKSTPGTAAEQKRIRLLDSRPWHVAKGGNS